MSALAARLDRSFVAPMNYCLPAAAVWCDGMGKSGHIATRLHRPWPARHAGIFFASGRGGPRDLGMITDDDVVIALSNSGESPEILAMVPFLKRRGIKFVALSGNPRSTLGREADVHLDTSVEKEACPLNLAPTASTTANLALGDALAISLLEARGFSERISLSLTLRALGRRLRFASQIHAYWRTLAQVATGLAPRGSAGYDAKDSCARGREANTWWAFPDGYCAAPWRRIPPCGVTSSM